jgi:hypothetical protein
MSRWFILLALTAAALILTGALLVSIPAAAHPAAPLLVTRPNCRLGYTGAYTTPLQYPITDLARLDAGQFIGYNATANPPDLAGAETIQMMRVHQNKVCSRYDCDYVVPYTYTLWPDLGAAAAIARARPGSLWLLGNEIDRRDWIGGGRQDEMLPELYAAAFHAMRTAIKNADPTARIAPAGVIQATPLRLQYLDRVWNEYARLYGAPMPVDVWNVHAFIFREKRFYVGCPDCWGADVPPGINVPNGVLWTIQDTISMTIFADQLVAFRQWMASKGERDKPLLVSEYAAFPEDFFAPGAAVNYILTGTFAYMRDARSPTLGYPGDDNRLVQRWVLYSLDDTRLSTSIMSGGVLAPLGTAWINYVADPANGFNPRATSLHFRALRTNPLVLYSPDGGPIDATLYPQIDNSGTISTTQSFSVRLVDSQWPLGGLSQFAALDGCGARASGSGVVFYDMRPGVHTVTAQLAGPPAQTLGQVSLLVATHQLFLPYVLFGTRPVTP